jgi:hypothetical protein
MSGRGQGVPNISGGEILSYKRISLEIRDSRIATRKGLALQMGLGMPQRKTATVKKNERLPER